ncbi:MAG: lipopolysaccharide biosynthesis protein [Chitinophagaceae bacterium]|nr:lipopolysaccharide biosynthesis protein [Chitinophagaceae bacterium]
MIKNIKELGKDSIYYGLSSVVGQIAGIILVPFFTSELTPFDYGILGMIGFIVTFAGPISGLALDTGLFRFFTIGKSDFTRNQYFSTAAITKLMSTSIFSIIFVLSFKIINGLFFENYLQFSTFITIVATFWIDSFSSLSIAVLRSERKTKLIAVNNLVNFTGSIFLSVLFVLILKMGVIGAVWASFFTSIIKVLLYINVNRGIFGLKYFNFKAQKELLKYCLPLVPHKIQGNITGLFTSFIINQKLGLVYSGYYSLASKVAKPFSMIVTIVQQSWTPFKFHIHKNDLNPKKSFSELISFYWLFLIVIFFIIAQIAPFLFKQLIDSRYHEAIFYVPFLMTISLFLAFYFTVTTGFELEANQNPIILSSLAPMLFIIIFSILLIDFYKPYVFFVIQSLAPLISALIIYPRARKVIEIEYHIPSFSILFLISIIMIYFTYNTVSIGLLVFINISFFILIGIFAVRIFTIERIVNSIKSLKSRLLS